MANLASESTLAMLSDPGFASKERDAETGLDYFGARYFSGAQGRFTSPDAPFADQHLVDPQSWNMYSYVRNNPLKLVDQDGEAAVLATAAIGAATGAGFRVAANYFSGRPLSEGVLKEAAIGAGLGLTGLGLAKVFQAGAAAIEAARATQIAGEAAEGMRALEIAQSTSG